MKKHKGGAHHIVYGDDVRVVCAQEKDAVLRLQDVRSAVLQQHTTLHLPLQTISPHRGRIHNKTIAAVRQSTKHTTKQKRKQWVEQNAASLTADTAIFIDETPFNFNIIRRRGRSRKGQAALGVVPAIRGKNHTVIAALSPARGLLYYEIHVTAPTDEFINKKSNKTKKTAPKGVDRERFRTFLINLFSILSSKFASSSSSTPLLLFDNARIHTGDIDETIFQTGYRQLRLAAWSPELNPIEYAFSKWKLAYRVLYPATEAAVNDAIKESAKSITAADSQHYFNHTQSLYARVLDLEDL